MALTNVTGVSSVLNKLHIADKTLSNKFGRGLIAGGRFLLAESQRIVPVRFGNLKASGFIRKQGTGWNVDVIVGYTAGYAVYVHENLDKAHGKAFNVKYAKEISANAHKITRGRNKGKVVYRGKSPYFPRGENQQAKFLERPMREKRQTILTIIKTTAGKV